jgi:hypothetical protein
VRAAILLPESSGTLPFPAPIRATAAARNRNRRGPVAGRIKQRSVHMDTKTNSSVRGLGGWAVFADFSGLLLKASAAGLAASLLVGGVVLIVASLGS